MAQHLDMDSLLEQARAMQDQLVNAEGGLKDQEVSASAGGGTVKVGATGDMRIKSIAIDPSAVDPDDVELLQDMIMAAVNEALTSAEDAASQQLGNIAGGLNIPGLF